MTGSFLQEPPVSPGVQGVTYGRPAANLDM